MTMKSEQIGTPDITVPEKRLETYYKSLEKFFSYRINHQKAQNRWENVNAILVLVLVLSILPIFPSIFAKHITNLLQLINQNSIDISIASFWLHWLFCVMISGIAYSFYYPLYNRVKKKFNNNSNPSSTNNFCFLYLAKNEIKNYLTNGQGSQLENAKKYLKKISSCNTRITLGKQEYEVENIIETLQTELQWFNIDQKTKEHLTAISDFKLKIFKRLEHKISVEEIIPIINWLIFYEYSKIKGNDTNLNGDKISDYTLEYFNQYVKTINSISYVDIASQKQLKTNTNIHMVLEFFKMLFQSQNTYIVFFLWLILLTLLLVSGAVILHSFIHFAYDTTIIIALITTPFIGAITFAASKNNQLKS